MNRLKYNLAITIVTLGLAGPSHEILVIDGEQDRVIGSISDVSNVHGLAASAKSGLLVAGSMSLAPKNQAIPEGMSEDEHNAHHADSQLLKAQAAGSLSNITIIDANARRIVKRIDVDGISHHSEITPDGRYALATHTTAGNVSIIDLHNRSLLKTLETGPVPNYILVTSNGKFAYVSNSGNNTISEIAVGQWTVRRNFKTGTTPEHMVFSDDEKILYVINVGDNSVSAISLANGSSIATYPVGQAPHGIDISDDGKRLFVSNKKGNTLTDPAPYHIKRINGTGKLYVSSRAQPMIWVIDQTSLDVIGQIPIRGEGHQMAVVQN
ncbi:MAG: beta-propeller fold lactonase family protein [Gammaproteobacteria bacterium]|nr:beta-propeller fold lactonase family protein [Gammaproteobacteria bacterium]